MRGGVHCSIRDDAGVAVDGGVGLVVSVSGISCCGVAVPGIRVGYNVEVGICAMRVGRMKTRSGSIFASPMLPSIILRRSNPATATPVNREKELSTSSSHTFLNVAGHILCCYLESLHIEKMTLELAIL